MKKKTKFVEKYSRLNDSQNLILKFTILYFKK